MFWLRTPQKLYIKKGCLSLALDELTAVYGRKKAFIVTDEEAYKKGFLSQLEQKLTSSGIQHTCFYAIDGMADIKAVISGAKQASLFEPDVIIASGSSAAMDAAKIIRLMYEYPDTDLNELSAKYNDIMSREGGFPQLGGKAILVAVPDIGGNASEVSPYAVISDGEDELVFADYELMPDMAVVDGDLMLPENKAQTASCGLNSLVRAVNAYDSVSATEYTDGFVIEAIKGISEYLPSVIENGANDPRGCEKLGEASAIAGIAYANTESIISVDGSAPYLADVVRLSAADNEVSAARYAALADALELPGDSEDERVTSFINKIGELVSLCGLDNKKCE